jgi:hypothetical protein
VTIADCLGLSRDQESQFWKHFGTKKYLSNMELYLSETDFVSSKYSVLNVIRCCSWPDRKTHLDNLVTNPITVLTSMMMDYVLT